MLIRMAVSLVFLIPLVISTGLASAIASDGPAGQPVTLETNSGVLHGTLLVPDGKGKIPVVLIIAGSGPTDRDGNSPLLPGHNDSLRMLAEALSQEGIASLRYDKRGIGESKVKINEADLRFDDYVSDAVGWINKLRADPRFSTVTVAGHSEGSLIGMIAAKRGAADGYVSISGISRPAELTLHDQLKPQFSAEKMKQIDAVLDSLSAGKTSSDFPPELVSIFRASVQPYLISWFKYDPSVEIAKLAVPVLILQGTSDMQVSVDDANRLAKASPHARLVLLDGMNHLLKHVGKDTDLQKRSYSDPTIAIDAELVAAVTKFVKTAVKR